MRFQVFYLLILATILCCDSNKKNKTDNTISTLPKELQMLNDSVLNDSKNPELYHRRALYYLKNKNAVEAMNNMKAVFMLDSSKAKYFVTLADIHFSQNNTRLTRDLLLRGTNKMGSKIDIYMRLGELYFYVKKYDEAFEAINESLKEDVHYAKAYFIKGMIYKETGDTTKSLSSFETAVQENPDYYDAYIQLGTMYASKKNMLAAQYFNNALNINPKSEEALYNIGMFYMNMGKHNKAIEAFTIITQINPNNKEAFFNLGYIHFVNLELKNEALQFFTSSINVDKNNERAYYMRGYVFEALGNISAAEGDYKKALALNPNYAMAQKGLVRVTMDIPI